ncbi:MAG: hypothetical protein QXO15_10690 [Nitrososphaerota archaeon]
MSCMTPEKLLLPNVWGSVVMGIVLPLILSNAVSVCVPPPGYVIVIVSPLDLTQVPGGGAYYG